MSRYSDRGAPPDESHYWTPKQMELWRVYRELGRESAPILYQCALDARRDGNDEAAIAYTILAVAAHLVVPGWLEAWKAYGECGEITEEFVEKVDLFYEVDQWQRARDERLNTLPVRCESRSRRASHVRPRARHQRTRRVSRVSSGNSPDDPAPGDPPLAAFDGRDLRRLVELALDTLPADGASWRAWERLEAEMRLRLGFNPEADS